MTGHTVQSGMQKGFLWESRTEALAWEWPEVGAASIDNKRSLKEQIEIGHVYQLQS